MGGRKPAHHDALGHPKLLGLSQGHGAIRVNVAASGASAPARRNPSAGRASDPTRREQAGNGVRTRRDPRNGSGNGSNSSGGRVKTVCCPSGLNRGLLPPEHVPHAKSHGLPDRCIATPPHWVSGRGGTVAAKPSVGSSSHDADPAEWTGASARPGAGCPQNRSETRTGGGSRRHREAASNGNPEPGPRGDVASHFVGLLVLGESGLSCQCVG